MQRTGSAHSDIHPGCGQEAVAVVSTAARASAVVQQTAGMETFTGGAEEHSSEEHGLSPSS